MTPDELRARFYSRIKKTDTCWLWVGSLSEKGYGIFYHNYKTTRAHRMSLELSGSTIPHGMQIDHLCRVRNCVNPSHLQIVDAKTNVRRGVGVTAINAMKTACDSGHRLSAENTYIDKTSYKTSRLCRACRAEAQKRYMKKRREKPNG